MGKITISVRCSTGPKFDFQLDDQITVFDLKSKLAVESRVPKEQQRLIFRGRVLKDELTVEHYAIEDGDAIHLVASSTGASHSGTSSSAAAASSSSAASGDSASSGPAHAQARSAVAGVPSLGMGMGSPPGMPPGLDAMMDNPFVQSMLENPELMRSLMMANPQVRAMVEQNPHLGQILSDPELLRTTMNAARNPALMNELMRNQDRAIANIESLPGGYNALARMYEDVAPMMDAPLSNSESTSSSTTADAGTSSESGQGHGGAPIPNPWGGNSNTSGSSNRNNSQSEPGVSPFAGLGGAGSGMPNLFGGAFPFPQSPNGNNNNSNNTGNTPFGFPAPSPELMAQMMRAMSSNGGSGFTASPFFGNGGSSNNFAGTGSGSGGADAVAAAAAAAAKSHATSTANASARAASLRSAPNPWAPADSPDSPQVKYKSQLEEMESMGFPDVKTNIQALLRCNGDVGEAIEFLLGDSASS